MGLVVLLALIVALVALEVRRVVTPIGARRRAVVGVVVLLVVGVVVVVQRLRDLAGL